MLEAFKHADKTPGDWTVVNFGKHHGKTLPHIALTDPDWFFWAIERKVFKTGSLKAEADEVWRKATQIRIPRSDPANWEVEYALHPGTGTLVDVAVVPANKPAHVGTTETFRAAHFDLSMARQFPSYDKLGARIIIRALKCYVIGNSNARMTRQRCERFFNDDSNFS